jgi:hypothetical protein
MEPGQYTGKTDATQGEPAAGESPSSAPASSAAPTSAPVASGGTVTRRPAVRTGGNFVRLVGWGAVLAILAAGLVMYFRYERAVVPLFGRGR